VRELPADFVRQLERLSARYLGESDPRRQSGFSGGVERWRLEREPILEAIPASGELLDVGCANGHLLECLLQWAVLRGVRLTPFGVDLSPDLIALARERLSEFRTHFFCADAFTWQPPRRFRYVYAVWDCVPPEAFGQFVQHLLVQVTAPGGRLIVGAYGSRTRREAPAPVNALLTQLGHPVIGHASAGRPETARFAWIDAPSESPGAGAGAPGR
jgi:SAM-dependent methyltransferase